MPAEPGLRCVSVPTRTSFPAYPAEAQPVSGVLMGMPDGESCCQITVFTGGIQCLELKAGCSCQEYELAQQVGFRASVHRGLELLDAVDGALDCAGVVFQGQPGDDSVQVAAQPGGERAQHW